MEEHRALLGAFDLLYALLHITVTSEMTLAAQHGTNSFKLKNISSIVLRQENKVELMNDYLGFLQTALASWSNQQLRYL